jgi:hypothetical protein
MVAVRFNFATACIVARQISTDSRGPSLSLFEVALYDSEAAL